MDDVIISKSSSDEENQRYYDVEKVINMKSDVKNNWWVLVSFVGDPEPRWTEEENVSECVISEYIEQLKRQEELKVGLGGRDIHHNDDCTNAKETTTTKWCDVDKAENTDVIMEAVEEKIQTEFICNYIECTKAFHSERSLNIHKAKFHKRRELTEQGKSKIHKTEIEKNMNFTMTEFKHISSNDEKLENKTQEGLSIIGPLDLTSNNREELSLTMHDDDVAVKEIFSDVQTQVITNTDACITNEPLSSKSESIDASDKTKNKVGNNDHHDCQSSTDAVKRKFNCIEATGFTGKKNKIEPDTETKVDKIAILKESFATTGNFLNELCEENLELKRLLTLQKRFKTHYLNQLCMKREKIVKLEKELEDSKKENMQLKMELEQSNEKRLELEKYNALQTSIQGISTTLRKTRQKFFEQMMTNDTQFEKQLERLEFVAKNQSKKQN